MALAQGWKLGDPLQEDTRVGPLASESQLQTVTTYSPAQGARDGARVLVAGSGPTTWETAARAPTAPLACPQSAVVREEIFGPVAAVLTAQSYEEALALANDTPYGLTSSLFTP